MKGCNTVQNIDEDISLRDQVILTQKTKTILGYFLYTGNYMYYKWDFTVTPVKYI